MKRILFIIHATLPKTFTRKQFNIVIRDYSITSILTTTYNTLSRKDISNTRAKASIK